MGSVADIVAQLIGAPVAPTAPAMGALVSQNRFANFRRSDNIEDRRDDSPQLGPFGTLGLPDNVFDVGHGTMVALNPHTDFAPVPVFNALSDAAGLRTLDPTYDTRDTSR